MIPARRVPSLLEEERDLGAAQERDKWRAEVERMPRKDENAEYESDYTTGWNDALEQLLKNMEARK